MKPMETPLRGWSPIKKESSVRIIHTCLTNNVENLYRSLTKDRMYHNFSCFFSLQSVCYDRVDSVYIKLAVYRVDIYWIVFT